MKMKITREEMDNYIQHCKEYPLGTDYDDEFCEMCLSYHIELGIEVSVDIIDCENEDYYFCIGNNYWYKWENTIRNYIYIGKKTKRMVEMMINKGSDLK